MAESMRAHGYTLPTAIADLIDNSISARCRKVCLTFEWNSTDSWISVTDDARPGATRSRRRSRTTKDFWDGIFSCARTYSAHELLAMTRAVDPEGPTNERSTSPAQFFPGRPSGATSPPIGVIALGLAESVR